MGFDITGHKSRIADNWRGQYFGMSQSRNRVAQGRGGVIQVVLPYSNDTIEWPADPWGNPYVHYLLFMDYNGTVDFIFEPNQEPDYACAIVSYGRNQVPGCAELGEASQADLNAMRPLRLYTGSGTSADPYRMLAVTQYTQGMAQAYVDPTVTTAPGVSEPGSDDIYFEF
jgi:hypothetical protein